MMRSYSLPSVVNWYTFLFLVSLCIRPPRDWFGVKQTYKFLHMTFILCSCSSRQLSLSSLFSTSMTFAEQKPVETGFLFRCKECPWLPFIWVCTKSLTANQILYHLETVFHKWCLFVERCISVNLVLCILSIEILSLLQWGGDSWLNKCEVLSFMSCESNALNVQAVHIGQLSNCIK